MQLTEEDAKGSAYAGQLPQIKAKAALTLVRAGYEQQDGRWMNPAEKYKAEWDTDLKNFGDQENGGSLESPLKSKQKKVKVSDVAALPGSGVALRIAVVPDLDHTGLIKKLAETYIHERVEICKETPFLIEFYDAENPSHANDLVEKGLVDVAFTDNIASDLIALARGVVDRLETVWRDHWMLVGPKTNPIRLPEDRGRYIRQLFVMMYIRIPQAKATGKDVEFLSRLDASTCNVKESSLWTEIGRTPWSVSKNLWYTTCEGDAVDALEVASTEESYTLTDRSTWWAAEQSVRDNLQIFAIGDDDIVDLQKPIGIIVGSQAENKERGNQFADWLIAEAGGQKVVQSVQQDGKALYSCIPSSEELLETSFKEQNAGGSQQQAASNPVSQASTAPLAALTTESLGPPRAGVNLYWSGNEMYFFDGPRYVRVDSVKDTITYSTAKDIKGMWPGLDGVSSVDAILPAGPKDSKAWFFSDDTVALLEVKFGGLASGNSRIKWAESDKFSAVKEAGIHHIDTVIPHFWPGGVPTQASFFSGAKYVTIDTASGELVAGLQDLPATFSFSEFTKVDTFVFVPNTNFQEGYFFSNGDFLRAHLPSMKLAYPTDTQNAWSSLKSADFFKSVA